MIVTYNWLKDYVELRESPAELAKLLAGLGLAAERVEAAAGDTIFDLEVMSNRPDLLSVIGVAREIAIATGRALKSPDLSIKVGGSGTVSIRVDAPDLCPRYVGRVIDGVKVGASPAWMQARLAAVGLRPVNSVVDVTNYVMLEFGQPLHAFDMAKLRGRAIVVRRAKAGEPITAIDGKVYSLTADDLVIADAEVPVAVAGVMGGKDSEIGDATTSVMLESAQFHGPSIRRTSRRLALASPSSYRFERGVLWSGVEKASLRAAQLIGGSCGAPVAVPKTALQVKRFDVRPDRVRRILGFEVPRQKLDAIMGQLDLERADLQREEDLIEEIARFVGYDKIPDDAPFFELVQPRDPELVVIDRVRDLLRAAGAQEVLTVSFEAPGDDLFAPAGVAPIGLRDPRGGIDRRLRRSLMPAFMEIVKTNEGYKQTLQPIFEVAKAYGMAPDPQERQVLGILVPGEFSRAKGLVELVVAELTGLAVSAAPAALGFADGAARLSVEGDDVGWVAQISHDVLARLEVRTPCAAAEIDLAPLAARAKLDRRASAVERVPVITRDVAIVVDLAVTWDAVKGAVAEAKPANLTGVRFFDCYTGKQVAPGKKSLAFSLEFRAPGRTLTGDEVQREVERVVDRLKSRFGAALRA